MGIKSRVRIEYWQNRTKVPTSNTMLYPEGCDIVSQADIDTSIAAFAHSFTAAWNVANMGASLAKHNFVSAGFSVEALAENIHDLKNDLSDRTMVRSANLNIAYPHSLFNTIRLVFEAQSTEEFFGDRDASRDVGHAPPPSTDSPVIQFELNSGRFTRNATYVIHLDELSQRTAANGVSFYSAAGDLRPFVFEFAVKELNGSGSLSVLHKLALNIFRQQDMAATACTDIVYWMRESQDELGHIVARRRLLEFSPRIEPMVRRVGNEFQFAEVPLVMENGSFMVEGKPYNFVSLNFSVVSRRKYNGVRRPIEVTAGYVPIMGGAGLVTHVTQPTLSPAMDDRGQVYVAEGVGSASVFFSPSEVSPGTMVFSAMQEPGGWTTQQDVRVFRI